MEEAFQDLRRLIWEAARGLKCECIVTVRAYHVLAEKAARELLEHAVDEDDEKRVRVACDYAERFCLRQKKWGDVVRFMDKFWDGFEDGFFERTQPGRVSKYYELGYKLGRYGK